MKSSLYSLKFPSLVLSFESGPKNLFPNCVIGLRSCEVGCFPSLFRRFDDLLSSHLRDPRCHVVVAIYRIDNHDRITEDAKRLRVFGKADLLFQARLGDIHEKPPESFFDQPFHTFSIQEVGHDQLNRERFEWLQLRVVPPAFSQTHERTKVLIRFLAITNELDLTGCACLQPDGGVFSIKLPPVAGTRTVFDDGNNVYAKTAPDK